jgi:hypothetical protein
VRNKANAGELIPSCMGAVCAVNRTMGDIDEVVCRPSRSSIPCHAWQRPQQDVLKINVDGGFQRDDGVGIGGFIIRNHMGDSVLAGAVKVKPVRDALSAEAMACLFALESAEQVGISRIELEMDCSLHKAEIWPLVVCCSGVSESYFMIILFVVKLLIFLGHVTRLRTRLLN